MGKKALAVRGEQGPGREIGTDTGDLGPSAICAGDGSSQRLGGGSTGTHARYRTALTCHFAGFDGPLPARRRRSR